MNFKQYWDLHSYNYIHYMVDRKAKDTAKKRLRYAEEHVFECFNYMNNRLDKVIQANVDLNLELVNTIDKMQAKIDKLKSLMLLTDPHTSHETAGELQARQWSEFVNIFPDEW